MAHFAEIDENNNVVRVLVTDNNDPNGDEGYQWLVDNFGGTWIKGSYNTNCGEHVNNETPIRYNYPSEGYTYDPVKDAFIPPQRYPSWILDEETCCWQPPVPRPSDFSEWQYIWDEESLEWVRGVKNNF